MDRPLQIFLLGLPELRWQDQPFSLARCQARALLFYLADELQPVSRDRLTFLLWPDTAETTARRNLTRLLSYIHQTLLQADLLRSEKSVVILNSTLAAVFSMAFPCRIALNSSCGSASASAGMNASIWTPYASW
jgi:DNA-binding SARP family transcriptional activator